MIVKRGQKILALCQKGNSRSVALAFLFKKRGADALSAGLVTSSKETINMLCQWAELVIVTDEKLVSLMPVGHEEKLKIWNVGTDKWFRGFKQDLLDKYEEFISQEPANV
jgi:predicted protein tyrosine phosphatase